MKIKFGQTKFVSIGFVIQRLLNRTISLDMERKWDFSKYIMLGNSLWRGNQERWKVICIQTSSEVWKHAFTHVLQEVKVNIIYKNKQLLRKAWNLSYYRDSN